MNRDQVEVVARMVKAMCPQQQMDAFTVDTWHSMGLNRVDQADAIEALRRLAARQPFIALAELLTEVRLIRRDRIERDTDNATTAIPLTKDDAKAEANQFIQELRRRTHVAAELRRPPQQPNLRVVRGELVDENTGRYIGKPGQPGFTVHERRPETEDLRKQLAALQHRPSSGDDRPYVRARAVLATVNDPDEWLAQARAALVPPADDRAVTIKAADLIRAAERATPDSEAS